MSFHKCNSIGKKGEEVVKKWLRDKEYQVIDFSDHSYMQSIDVDLAVSKQNQAFSEQIAPFLVEIKTDRHNSGNLFIETVSNATKKTLGCIYATRADWWLYVLLGRKEMIAFRPKKMIELIENNNFREIEVPNRFRDGGGYITKGVLVPIDNIPFGRFYSLGDYLDEEEHKTND